VFEGTKFNITSNNYNIIAVFDVAAAVGPTTLGTTKPQYS